MGAYALCTVYFGPAKPAGINEGNRIKTVPRKGWNTILRRYGPLEPRRA